MKFGVRTPSIKKSIKSRTTGKLKRTVKKTIVPEYGKKGMGWLTDPKKAAYNKVYNKTSIGVADLISGGNNTKGSRKNRSYQEQNIIIDKLNHDLQIMNESAKIMQSTSSPDTFFERYDLYLTKLHVLADAEKSGINFEGDSPVKKLKEISTEKEKTELTNGMIDNFWNKTVEKMSNLKTEKGKNNQLIKFSEKLSAYDSRMTQASINYYKNKL